MVILISSASTFAVQPAQVVVAHQVAFLLQERNLVRDLTSSILPLV